jgi:RNA polymerase sigma factor (sigma-70 family)
VTLQVALTDQHVNLVHGVIRRCRFGGSYADLVGIGKVALTQAAHDWRADRDVPFEIYAGARIANRIRDEMRHTDHLTRSQRKAVSAGTAVDPGDPVLFSLDDPGASERAARLADPAADVFADAWAHGRRDRVHDALSRLALHPDRRIAGVVYAYHFLGVTLDDIAAAIGICPRNAWRLLDLGRRWLADDLADLAQAA